MSAPAPPEAATALEYFTPSVAVKEGAAPKAIACDGALILRLKVGGAGEHDLLGSDFLKSLSVREPPDWLETVFRDDGVMVFAPKERCASS